MGDWDPVERVPYQPAQTVEQQVPFKPVMGARNALMPQQMKVLATVPARPRASNTIQWRPANEDEASRGIAQVGSNGAFRYAPKGTGPVNPDAPPKLAAADLGYITKARAAADELNNMSSEMQRFTRLNKNVDTGGVMAVPGVNTMLAPFDADRSTMNSIISRITPAMRNGLPGAASDRDVAMFRDATVGMDKPQAANSAIADAAKAYAARHSDHVAFMEAYARKNGTLLGASERWKEYVDSNPLFDDNTESGLKVNKIKPWRSQFQDLKPNTQVGQKIRHYDPATGTFKD